MTLQTERRLSALEAEMETSDGPSTWDIAAITDPIERAIWSAKYSAYCRAFEMAQNHTSQLSICYDSDILKELRNSGVTLPFDDEIENGVWMNEAYERACKKAVPIHTDPKPYCIFLGVAEGRI